MLTGPMDRVIAIQTNTQSQDGDGAVTDSWATTLTIWAQRMDLKMMERMQAQLVDPKTSVKYYTHYYDTVVPGQRIVEGSNTYEILGVVELGRRKGLEITAGTI